MATAVQSLGERLLGSGLNVHLLRRWSSLLVGVFSVAIAIYSYRQKWRRERRSDAEATDPALLKKYSSYDAYEVSATGFGYPRIRTVYHAHSQAAKLPTDPAPLPLLVFIHGLGGSAAQFAPLLTSLINMGPCLLIDLPGCGLSSYAPHDWEAYTPNALVHLLDVIIERHRDVEHGQGIVLVAHSMGCSLSALLASNATGSSLVQHVLGLVAMCPRASGMTAKQIEATRRITRVPGPIFELFRMWDRRGGVESHSVRRMAGSNADTETKKLQLRYNVQSRTPVWRRMTRGLMPKEGSSAGLPQTDLWTQLECPIYLIAGEDDLLCPPSEVRNLATALRGARYDHSETALSDATLTEVDQSAISDRKDLNKRILKTHILHSPASHALPYSPSTVRTLSGLIQNFLSLHVDPHLSLGWQLTYLSDSGKWDVKNLVKWQKTASTSSPIGVGPDGAGTAIFLAMKTMREVDGVHTPKIFAAQWSSKVQAMVDISHESPVYDPRGLEQGGIEYHKCPSVSKLPPNDEEVASFEELIDRLRAQQATPLEQSGNDSTGVGAKLIAVHCHYGFNRTGYFIVCYLVDRLGWKLQDAIDEFARCKPPGIKHSYFVDALFVRYCGDSPDG